MKYIILISSLFILLLTGCKPPDEEPVVFDFRNYPGIAVIGNEAVTVVYSDDERVFDNELPVAGGILDYYFGETGVSYINGSRIQFLDDTDHIAGNTDTFGLDPFFSPYKKIDTKLFSARTQIFTTGEGLIVQRVSIQAVHDFNTFVQWSLYTPVETGSVNISATDILEDGIYHRYNNDFILAIAAVGEHSRYAFYENEEITTVTTPLRLTAGKDTTLTFFITGGTDETDIIIRMFAAESGDLFGKASGFWEQWLAGYAMPGFPHKYYEHSFKINTYAAYAAGIYGEIPRSIAAGPGMLSEMAKRAQDKIMLQDRISAKELIHTIIEHSNSYGVIPELDNEKVVHPLSPAGCSELSTSLAMLFKEFDV